MALSSAFRERLKHMEHSRNERLILLQAEKEIQVNKCQVLESKLVRIRSMERSCLLLDQKIASQNFRISALRSEIENLDAKYDSSSRQLRDLKSDIEELEEVEKERDKYYVLKSSEINEFRESVERFSMETRNRVQEMRNCVNELKSTFMELQGNNGYMSDADIAEAEIAEAEMKRAEQIAMKESSTKTLASYGQRKEELQKQVENMLVAQSQERCNPFQFGKSNGV